MFNYPLTSSRSVPKHSGVRKLPVDLVAPSLRSLLTGRNSLEVLEGRIAPAGADLFSGATILASLASVSDTGSNVGATGEVGEPNHVGLSGSSISSGDLQSVWWGWTAPLSGTVVIDTFGSNYDTTLAVYTGSAVASLTTIAGNDDFSGLQSQVSFDVTAGTTYWIAVDGYGSATGNIVLNVEATADLTADLVSGNLVVTDTSAGGRANALTVTLSGSDLVISDAAQSFAAAPAGGTLSNFNRTLTIPLSSVTGSITLNTNSGSDFVTLDLSGGDFITASGLFLNGGAGDFDSLAIVGGAQGAVAYHYINANDGSISMSNFGVVHYTGLEPISNSGTATSVVFNLPAGSDQVVLEDNGVTGDSLLRLRSANASFETTVFANPSGSVTINTGGGLDTFVVHAVADLTAAVTLGSAGAPFSTITLNADIVGAVSGAANVVNVNAPASIQDGVNLALTGGTVNVGAGTFGELVTVNKSLFLLGAQAGVDGRTRNAVPETIVTGNAGSTSFYITADGVTIDGFTVQGQTNVNLLGAGIVLGAGTSGAHVLNNIIQNNVVGLFLSNHSSTAPATVEKNLFRDNTNPGAGGGHDIYADEFTSGAGLQNVQILNNTFTNTALVVDSWALGVSNTGATAFQDITFSGNEVTNHGRGAYFYHTDGATITGNTFDGATNYGIGIFGWDAIPGSNSNFQISGNTFENSARGIYLADDTTAPAYSGPIVLSPNTYINTTTPIAFETYGGQTMGAFDFGSANVTITGDDLDFTGGPGSITGTGILTIVPLTQGGSIGLNGAVGTLALSNADLLALGSSFAQIVIGEAGAGHDIVYDANLAFTFSSAVVLNANGAGGSIAILDSNLGNGLGAFRSAGTVQFNGTGATTTLSANIVTTGVPISINDSVILTAAVTLDTTDGGAVPAGATISITGNIGLGANTLTWNAGAAATAIHSVISGSGGLTKLGTGTLTLTNNNAYTGTTTVNAGTLQAAGTNTPRGAIGNSANIIVNNGGTISSGTDSSSAIYDNGMFGQSSTGTLTINAGGTVSIIGGLSQHLPALVLAGGTLTVVGPTTGSGAIHGNYNLDHGFSTSGAGVSTVSGGVITMTQAGTTVLNVGAGHTVNFSSVLGATAFAPTPVLGKTGAGTLVLSGANTYASATEINAGTLAMAEGGSINASSAIQLGATSGTNSATLSIVDSNGGTTLTPQITVRAGSTGVKSISSTNTSGTNTIASGILANAPFTLQTTGASGTLQLSAGGSINLGGQTMTVDATAGSTVELSRQVTGGAGNAGVFLLQKTGAGKLILSGNTDNNDLSLRVSTGSVELNKTTANAVANLEIAAGATVTLTGAANAQIWDGGTTTVRAGGVLNLNGINETIGNLIVDAGSAVGATVTTGTGTLTLAGNVTLQAPGSGATGASISGNLNLGGAVRTFTVANGLAGHDLTISAAISNGGLTKAGLGTLTFSGSTANTYTGTTTILDGTLLLQKTAGVNSIAGNVSIGDASGSDILELGAGNQIADTAVLSFTSGMAGNSAKFNLAGFNETVGGIQTTLPGRLPVIQTFESGGSGTSTLTVNNNADYVYDGIIRNNAGGTSTLALVKSGTGTLTLAGGMTYTGSTNVNAGTLLVNGSITSNVTVTSPGTLGGNGTIAGNVNGNGTVAAGNSPGVLTITGDFVPTGTVLFEVNSPYNVPGTDYDQLIVGGIVDLSNATLSFTGGAAAPSPLQLLTLISKTSAGATVAGTSPAEGATVTIGSTSFKLFYNGGDGNDVVLVEASVPDVVYVEDTAWSGLTNGTVIADADFGTAGNQPAIYGVNAFSTITAGLGASTASGEVIVNAGAYAEAVNLNGTKTLIVTSGADVTSNSFASLAGTTLQINGTSFTTGNATSTTIAGVIAGAGTFTKQGSGTVTLTAANTYTGTTFVNGGVLRILNDTALGSNTAGTVVANGAALQLQGGITVAGELLTINGSGIGGSDGALRNVSGNNTWTGNITANPTGGAPTVARIFSDAGNLTISGNIALTGDGDDALVLGGNGSGTVSGVISGLGGVIKSSNGTGTWVLAANNTYGGTTTVSNGTLQVGAGGTTGSLGAGGASIGSGTLSFNRSDAFIVPNTISGGGTLRVADSGGITFTSTVSAGTVQLLNTTGTIAFDNSLTAGTLTTANQGYSVAFHGTTSVSNAASFLNTGSVTLGNGGDSLTFAGGLTTSGNASNPSTTNLGGSLTSTNALIRLGTLVLTANSNISSGTSAVDLTGSINGAFSLTVNSTGATTLGGAVSVGSLTTNAGGTTAINGGSVTTTGIQTYGDAVTLGANTTLTGPTVSFANTVTGGSNNLAIVGDAIFGGAVGGLGTLSVSGTSAINGGSITSSGSQTYQGNVTLGADASIATTGNSAISFMGTVSGAFALNIPNGTGDVTFAGAVGSPSSLTTLSVAGNNVAAVAITTTGAIQLAAQNALTLDGAVNAGAGTITLAANQDGVGAQGFVQNAGASITTTNNTAAAVAITVGGAGSASIRSIHAGTTAGQISITTNLGAITDGDGGAATNITAASATLTAGAGIGSALDPIETTVGTIAAQVGSGGVYLNESDSLTIGAVGANLGISSAATNVVITSGNLILAENVTTTGSVTLNSTGTITETTGAVKTAALLVTNSVGGQTLNGANTVATFNATNATSGNVELTNTATTLAIVQIVNPAGSTTVVNVGNVQLGTALNQNINVSGVARITATGGAITDGNTAPGDNNITALAAILTAGTTVGTAANPIEINVAFLEGSAGTGFFIAEANALTIGGITPADDGIVSGGNVVITSGALTITEQLVATGNVNLTAAGSIVESGAGRVSGNVLTTISNGGQVLGGANTVSTFTATNTGAGTGIHLENDRDGFVISTVTSQTGGEIYINNAGTGTTVTGQVRSGNPVLGGDISIFTEGVLTVNAAVDSRGGSGGTLTISNLVVLNTSPIVGFGDVTLQGGAGTLTINAPITVASGLTLQATEDVNILAKVETSSVLADLTVLADMDGDGVGGVYIGQGPGANQGQLKSGRNLDVRGSEYTGSVVPALGFLDNSVIIQPNGTTPRLEAVGNILVKNNNAAAFDSQIWLGGLVRSNTNGDIAFDNAVLVTDSTARVQTHGDGDVIFIGTIDSATGLGSPYNLRVSSSEGVVLFSGAVGQVAPLGDVLVDLALDVTIASAFSASSLTVSNATGTVDFSGPVTTTKAGVNLSVNAENLLINAPVNATASGAALGDTFFQVNTIAISDTVAGDGSLTIQPRDLARSIGVNAAGDLNLDSGELDLLVDGFSQIIIGRTNGTGLLSIGDRILPQSWMDPVRFLAGGTGGQIALLGQQVGTGNAAFEFFAPKVTVAAATTPTIVTSGGLVSFGSFAANAAVTLQSDLEILSNGGAVTMVGTVDGTFNLAINAGAGAVYINGSSIAVPSGTSVGGTTALNSVEITGGVLTLRPNIRTMGPQTYTSPDIQLLGGAFRSLNVAGGDITFNGDVTLQNVISVGTTDSAITFNGAVNNIANHTTSAGRGALRLDAVSGTVTFGGNVGAAFAPKTIDVSSAGRVVLGNDGSDIFIGGLSVTLVTDELDMAGNVSVPGGLLSIQTRLAETPIQIGGVESIGSSTLELSSADVAALGDGTASILIGRRLGDAPITVVSAVTFNDPVKFQQPAKVGGPTIINATLTGATPDGGFTFNGPATRLNGDIVTAGGAVDIENAVGVGALSTINTSAGNGYVTFRGGLLGLIGGENLTVLAGEGTIHMDTGIKPPVTATLLGTLTLTNDGVTRIERGLTVGGLVVDGGGVVILKGMITTTGAAGQYYADAVELLGSTDLRSRDAAGVIHFANRVDSNSATPTKAFNLAVTNRSVPSSGLTAQFDAPVGQSQMLGVFRINTTGDAVFGTGADVLAKSVSFRANTLIAQNVTTTASQTHTGNGVFIGAINALKLSITSASDLINGGAWNVTGLATLTAKKAAISVTGTGNSFGELTLRGRDATIVEDGNMVIRGTSLQGTLDLTTNAAGVEVGNITQGASRTAAFRLAADAAGSLTFVRPDTRMSQLGDLSADDALSLLVRGPRYTLLDGAIHAGGDILLAANPNGTVGSFRTAGQNISITSDTGRWVVYSYYAEYGLDGTNLATQLSGLTSAEVGAVHPTTPVPAAGNVLMYFKLRA